MGCPHSNPPGTGAQTAPAENSAAEKPAPRDPPAQLPAQGEADRVPGEYLVAVQKGGDESMIRRLFADASVQSVRQLRDDLFLIHVERDPGPQAMRQAAAGSDQIRNVQPNFVYRTNPPPANLPDQIR